MHMKNGRLSAQTWTHVGMNSGPTMALVHTNLKALTPSTKHEPTVDFQFDNARKRLRNYNIEDPRALISTPNKKRQQQVHRICYQL